MKAMRESTFKFTFAKDKSDGQYSGTEKKYIQWQAVQFRRLGYKVSKVIEVKKNKQNNGSRED
jgi:hypothetical protein